MRTDRTFVCTECRIRCWPVRRCPGCGETRALVDLARGAAQAGSAGARAGRASLGLTAAGTATIAAAPLAALVWGIGAAEAMLLLALPTLAASLLVRGSRGPAAGGAPSDRPWQILASPIVRSKAVREQRAGRVRPLPGATLVAPLSGRPCVAFRLFGEGDHGEIDDGRGARFEVEPDGEGERVLVDAGVATLELGPPGHQATVEPDPELARWLAARGVRDAARPRDLREAVLAEGDPVEVIGSRRREVRASGYRGSETVELLADAPGSPLIVRALPRDAAAPPASKPATGAPGPRR